MSSTKPPLAGVPPPPPTPAVPPLMAARPSAWSLLTRRISKSMTAFFRHESMYLQRYSPRWLTPDFVWPQGCSAASDLSPVIPRVPNFTSSIWRWCLGIFRARLCWFSKFYCAWYGVSYSSSIAQLPFGLILKWADGTSFDEAQSMMAVQKAGFPCPRVISVGEHRDSPSAPVSILMTRIPGEQLDEVYDELQPAERNAILDEISTMLRVMRSWKSPWGQRICSISGGPIRSIRVPNHRIGPCESEKELNDYLLAVASSHSFKSPEEFQSAIEVARKMDDLQHQIVFTHGDFFLHNILVHDGHVSGFIDWESAGWYPEYWEFTTPLRWPSRDPEGGDLFMRLGGERYTKELEAEKALMTLTVDSWIFV